MNKVIWIDRSQKLVVRVLLVLGSLMFMTPFYLMVVMALKTKAEVNTSSVWALPKAPTLDNFHIVLTNPNVNFAIFAKNTLTVATFNTIGVVLSASLVAYAFARLQFRGRDRLFILLISTMMLPGIVTLIPSYVLYKHLGWVNTLYPFMIPAYFGGGAFNIFLLRQSFMGVPRDLDEAAILDGAGHWTIFSRVIMPLSGSTLATVGIFSFVYNWKDFLGPLILLNDPDKMTLEVGLSAYNALRNTEWELIMAGSTLVSIPLIVLFFVGQRYFVQGIRMSGIK